MKNKRRTITFDQEADRQLAELCAEYRTSSSWVVRRLIAQEYARRAAQKALRPPSPPPKLLMPQAGNTENSETTTYAYGSQTAPKSAGES